MSTDKDKEEYLLKICAIGSGSVGKTSLIRRFAVGKFETNYLPTLGVDITTKKLELDGTIVKLILVDTAGQEFFGKLRPSYYRGASACLIMFALDDKDTFDQVPNWLSEFRKHIPDANIPIALAGNKKDLVEKRKVSVEEGNIMAKNYNMFYYETSAKTGGTEIDDIFVELTKQALKKQ